VGFGVYCDVWDMRLGIYCGGLCCVGFALDDFFPSLKKAAGAGI
jgi:hypothetical protein